MSSRIAKRAWAAGFFDGEGSTVSHRTTSPTGRIYRSLMCSMGQVDRRLLIRFRLHRGGLVNLSETYLKKGLAQMSIRKFIMDEVVRQGFERHSNDWAFRSGAMMAAWNYMLAYDGLSLTPRVVETLGMMVEPEVNRFGFRDCGVSVGGRQCPDWLEVPKLMIEWCRTWGGLGMVPVVADEAYYQYELVHPFRDGNGRTGKIIHNWLQGTLHSPVLVKDFFGGGVP